MPENFKKCNFCGKGENKVQSMFSAGDVNICDECVCYCYELLYGADAQPKGKGKSRKKSAEKEMKLLKPAEIKKVLDEYVIGHGIVSAVGAGVCFGIGYGMFDTNNMPILCQFVSTKHRATAYGIMNMTGVFAGAIITKVLGRWADAGNLGLGFALMAGVVAVALCLQVFALKPSSDNIE